MKFWKGPGVEGSFLNITKNIGDSQLHLQSFLQPLLEEGRIFGFHLRKKSPIILMQEGRTSVTLANNEESNVTVTIK